MMNKIISLVLALTILAPTVLAPAVLADTLPVAAEKPEPAVIYLPDKPQPQPQPKVINKEFLLYAGLFAASWAADTVSTSQSFGRNHNFHEVGGLLNGSRNTPQIMAAWAGVDLATTFACYEMKKHLHGHLRNAWKVPFIIGTFGHSRAATINSLN